jgi:hypothetical protein
MSTVIEPRVPDGTAHEGPTRPRGPHWGRVVFGLLVVAVGVASLLDGLGWSVPWRLAPAIALIVIGLALLVSLAGGTGRADLVVLGVIALVLAVGVGIGVDRYAGPVGDRTVLPARDGWPAPVQMAAGKVVVDLTGQPPPAGTARVAVGAGEVVLRVPAGGPVDVDVHVVAGIVLVDGLVTREGVDLQWSQGSAAPAPAGVVLDVGFGQVEVDHVAA